jgi:hypothetical protein
MIQGYKIKLLICLSYFAQILMGNYSNYSLKQKAIPILLEPLSGES